MSDRTARSLDTAIAVLDGLTRSLRAQGTAPRRTRPAVTPPRSTAPATAGDRTLDLARIAREARARVAARERARAAAQQAADDALYTKAWGRPPRR